ncbi:MAG: uracil-DNA glycosylase [Lentisphaeraceae bacterium]|nr:uracil-DNA glycosylase [Lentisphaeraceae bacterium]
MRTDWRDALEPFVSSADFAALRARVRSAYDCEQILPAREHIYAALQLCHLAQTRVVILGQDPYPTPGHAHGLAFSVQPPTQPPPSLRNILTEIASDLGHPAHITLGDLTPWARQGVLLLNAVLTVRAHAPLSHAGLGWEAFTDAIIRTVSERREHVVFLLWGAKAKAKRALIDPKRHLVLTAAHPSPLSAYNGFFGCRHFSQANAYLLAHGQQPIDW